MCSETSAPRLSFSHDLSELQILPIKQDVVSCNDTLIMDSNSDDFEFITNNNTLDFESCSADEIFCNGMILPIRIQQDRTKITTNTRKHTHYAEQEQEQHHHHQTKLPPRPFPPNGSDKIKNETIRELLLDVSSELQEKKPHPNKSFWGFSRSKSLNCDTKKSLICSLPLLSRSNSTGSAPANPKKMSSFKHQSASKSWSSSSSSCSVFNFYPVQKANSGQSYGGSYGNGVKINPVLNVPTPCVSKGSTNFFGLGSFLRVGKVKKNKK